MTNLDEIEVIAPHARDRTRPVADWLFARGTAETRNAARAFLLHRLRGLPARDLTPFMAEACVIPTKLASAHLSRFARRGIIRAAPGAKTFLGCTPGDGIDPQALLDLLGQELETRRPADRCRKCNGPLARGHCRACNEIEKQPWLARRIDFLAARAARREPLFDEPVPWAGGADRGGAGDGDGDGYED